MKVTSKIFGTGTVISQDANSVKVDFNGEVKNLALRFANLINEDGTPLYVEPKNEDGTPLYVEPKKAKKVAVKKTFTDVRETADFEFLFRTGVVDANGNHIEDVKITLMQAKKEARLEGKTGTR